MKLSYIFQEYSKGFCRNCAEPEINAKDVAEPTYDKVPIV